MKTYEMIRTLRDHHSKVLTGIAVVRAHCDANCVDGEGLEVARRNLITASRDRSSFVSTVIVPKLLSGHGEAPRDEISNLLCFCAAQRMVSDAHIAHWTAPAIATNPTEYCAAARKIWAMMEDQINLERQVLIRYLKELPDVVSSEGPVAPIDTRL